MCFGDVIEVAWFLLLVLEELVEVLYTSCLLYYHVCML